MKLIKITLILLIASSLVAFVKSDMFFHIAKTLPFCSGSDIQWNYEFGAIAMLCLFIWGLYRLNRNSDDDDSE